MPPHLNTMAAIVSMLRALNLAAHHRVKMEELRSLYQELGFRDARTVGTAGNVVFSARNAAAAAKQIEKAFQATFGFRSEVLWRSRPEIERVIARSPFAPRPEIEPGKLLIAFLSKEPSREACHKALAIVTGPEEVHIDGREIFIYYPNGMGRSKLPTMRFEKILDTPGTGRNWNTVRQLAEVAAEMEA